MSTVILDTNIFIRATALQVEDAESAFLNSSKHDRDSAPEKTKGGLSPRQCRALILTQMTEPNKILMPAQQAEEIIHVIDNMRRFNSIKPHNDTLLRCIEQFARNAAIGHNVPILAGHLQNQYDVIKEALSIAATVAVSGPPERRHRAERFMEKNQRFLVECLPEPNIHKLQNGRRPFVFNDWMLMHAAKRSGTIVATIDRDFDFLSEAFIRVTGYSPSRILEYYPTSADLPAFLKAIEKKKSEAPEIT